MFFPGKKKVEVSFCQIVTETESEKLKGLDVTCIPIVNTLTLSSGTSNSATRLSKFWYKIVQAEPFGLKRLRRPKHALSVKQSKLCTKQAQNWPWALLVCLCLCLCLNFTDSALSSLNLKFWIFDEVKSLVCQRRRLTKKEKEENIWRRKISGQRRRIGIAGKCSGKEGLF